MKKVFLLIAMFSGFMISCSDAQQGQKELRIDKVSTMPRQATVKAQFGTKSLGYGIVSLKGEVRKWKREMTASSRGYGFAKFRRCNNAASQQVRMPVAVFFQNNYGHMKQLVYSGRKPGVNVPALILPADDKDDGVNINLSRKTSLSLDFGGDDKADAANLLMADDATPDIDISVGFSIALR